MYLFEHQRILIEDVAAFKCIQILRMEKLYQLELKCARNHPVFSRPGIRGQPRLEFRTFRNIRVSLIEVWILWCSCDHFCYISRWSSLVGGKILESFYRFNCRLIEIIRVNLISFVTRKYELGDRVDNFCRFSSERMIHYGCLVWV